MDTFVQLQLNIFDFSPEMLEAKTGMFLVELIESRNKHAVLSVPAEAFLAVHLKKHFSYFIEIKYKTQTSIIVAKNYLVYRTFFMHQSGTFIILF